MKITNNISLNRFGSAYLYFCNRPVDRVEAIARGIESAVNFDSIGADDSLDDELPQEVQAQEELINALVARNMAEIKMLMQKDTVEPESAPSESADFLVPYTIPVTVLDNPRVIDIKG